MLWLSVLAGSLVLHLVVLLAGRWYLSQPAGNRAAGSPAPLDFVEVDPNAPALKQPIAPSKTATANSTPQTSAAPESKTSEQSQQPSIQSLSRQATPERSQSKAATPERSQQPSTQNSTRQAAPEQSQPIASPKPETKPNLRSSSGEFPTTQTPSQRNPATTSPNPTPSTRPSNPSNPGSTQNPPSDSPGGANPSGITSPSTSTPSGSTSPTNPSTSTPPGNNSADSGQTGETSPVTSGASLPGNGLFGGQVSELQIDPNARQDDGALSVTFKMTEIPSIELPIAAPKQVLDLRVTVTIDNATGTVAGVNVRDDSPTLLTSPNLKEASQSIAYALLPNAGQLFDVIPKSKTDPAFSSRIIRLRIDGRSVKAAP